MKAVSYTHLDVYKRQDQEEIVLSQGDWIKIKPAGKRQFFANTDMTYICIQVKENSLESFTAEDAILV